MEGGEGVVELAVHPNLVSGQAERRRRGRGKERRRGSRRGGGDSEYLNFAKIKYKDSMAASIQESSDNLLFKFISQNNI